MGVEDDLTPAEPTPEELYLGERIANLAQHPSDEARARIMAAVRSTAMPATAPRRRSAVRRRWRLALAGFGAACLFLSISAGALAASSDALPNSPAYELRRFEENLRVAVADPREQARLRLQFAAERVRQAKAEIRRGNVSVATKLLSDSRHDLEEAQIELHDIHDQSKASDLAREHDRVQSDAASEQNQLETNDKGRDVVSPPGQPSPTPGDGSNVPAPEGTTLPTANPNASPANNSDGSPDHAPTP
jgi:hypothetical protein